jgi:integrase
LRRLLYVEVPLGKDEAKAIEAANAINARLDQHRGAMPVLAQNRHGTLPWLIEAYKQSVDYKTLRDSTKAQRKVEFSRILSWSEKLGHPPMRCITKRDAEALWASIVEEGQRPRPRGSRGKTHREHPMQQRAETIIERCSQLWNYALDLEEDIVERNVFRKLLRKLPDIPPREQRWEPEQVEAMCAKAVELGYPSIALATILGINTAQRPGDILAMRCSQYDPIVGKNGVITVVQSKTGAVVRCPVTDVLKLALDDLKRQRIEGKVVGIGAATDGPIVVHERTGRAWRRAAFNRWFNCIRDAAGIPDDLQFRDLRRTATTQLAEAGCSPHEIASIGGWTVDTVAKMMRVYAPVNLTMAQNAIVKLEQYRAKQSQG